MWTSLLLIALAATPAALEETVEALTVDQKVELTVDRKLDVISDWLELVESRRQQAAGIQGRIEVARDLELHSSFLELGAQVETLKNATAQLLEELDIVRNRQAASAAVQASQVIMMVTYFLTILSVYIVKRCQKMSEKSKRKEFERLEMQLRSSKAKRRAAAAKEKSAPAQSLE